MIIWRVVLLNIILMAYLKKLIPKSSLKGPTSQFVNMEHSFYTKWMSDWESQRASNERGVRGTREKEKKVYAPVVTLLFRLFRPPHATKTDR